MTNAENEEARRRYQVAFSNRGTPREPGSARRIDPSAPRNRGPCTGCRATRTSSPGGAWSKNRRRFCASSTRSRTRSAISSARKWPSCERSRPSAWEKARGSDAQPLGHSRITRSSSRKSATTSIRRPCGRTCPPPKRASRGCWRCPSSSTASSSSGRSAGLGSIGPLL